MAEPLTPASTAQSAVKQAAPPAVRVPAGPPTSRPLGRPMPGAPAAPVKQPNPNLLQDLLNSLEKARSTLKYFLLLEEDAEPMCVQEFPTKEALVVGLRNLLEKPKPGMRVLIFQGTQLFLSKGPYRYLVAGEEKVPLFILPTETEIDTSGYLVPELRVEIVPPAPVDEQDAPEEDEEEDADSVRGSNSYDPLEGGTSDPLT